MPYVQLADAVLVVHFAVVVFVVFGLPLIVIGNRQGWAWVNGFAFRALHAAAIVIIAAQAWLGQYCPLTILESWLRVRGGQAPYQSSFIQHWIEQVLYFNAPLWMFALAYTAFAVLVGWAWRRYPPVRTRVRATDGMQFAPSSSERS